MPDPPIGRTVDRAQHWNIQNFNMHFENFDVVINSFEKLIQKQKWSVAENKINNSKNYGNLIVQ